MYGKKATVNLIESMAGYDDNTEWGSALRCAVELIEEAVVSDDDFLDDVANEIYFMDNQRDLTFQEIFRGVGKYIKEKEKEDDR